MAGKPGMHQRASRSPTYANAVRARINAAGITKLLEQHVVGKREMTKTQVSAALGLLKKVVPDLSSTEMTGANGADLIPKKIEVELVRPSG